MTAAAGLLFGILAGGMIQALSGAFRNMDAPTNTNRLLSLCHLALWAIIGILLLTGGHRAN